MNTGDAFLGKYVIVPVLVFTGFLVTVYLGFLQLRKFGHAVQVILGKYDNPEDEGDINHFQALTTALSATVGIGNIAGVATAIHYGGPGALFWMWVTGFFGMALKYHECTLSMAYRDFDEKGDASGGPMYYIEKGMGKAWKPLAIFFAVCAIFASFGGGNMNQANTVALSVRTDLVQTEFGGIDKVTGVVMAIFVGLVIIGGIRRIGAVTSKLAPTMMTLYCLGALAIILANFGKVPGVFAEILSNAFRPEAGFGGAAAGTFAVTLLWGVKRGLFSNEAGQGSAPIAHAAAKTKEPVREGAVAMVGPFIDTLTVCTMTGLVILISGVWNDHRPGSSAPMKEVTVYHTAGHPEMEGRFHDLVRDGVIPAYTGRVTVKEGVLDDAYTIGVQDAPVLELSLLHKGEPFSGSMHLEEGRLTSADGPKGVVNVDGIVATGAMVQNSSALTSWAFQRGLEKVGFPWGSYIVAISVLLFGISTMISWSYYGDRCVTYLFGAKYVLYYRIIYCVFIFLGANLTLKLVWAYGDLALFLMTIPNLIALFFLMGETKRMTIDYFGREHIPYR